MCGIFGIISLTKINIYKYILDGLIQLQNRGYDSSGIGIINNINNSYFFDIIKRASTNDMSSIDYINNYIVATQQIDQKGHININNDNIGIGHNRWATHGGKTDYNAHPHISNDKKILLVHNGIIENYIELKQMLLNNDYTFYSETDTEIIVNLISYFYKNDNIITSINKTTNLLKGTYGLIILCIDTPDNIYCIRQGSPILIGYNNNMAIITSEQSGFCKLVNNYMVLNNNDLCIINTNNNKINVNTNSEYKFKDIQLGNYELTPYPYKHWTLKEIFEQPFAINSSLNLGGRIKNEYEVKLGGIEKNSDLLIDIEHIIFLGCGTSYHAGLYASSIFKNICDFTTVSVYDGADFNENDIPKRGKTAFILISQSGETKDLHRCIQIANNNNIITIGIINVVDSLIAREVLCGIYCNSGKENAVASTKAFTSMIITISLLSVWFAQKKNINLLKRKQLINDLHNLSEQFKQCIDNCNNLINNNINKEYIFNNNMFILGKGTDEYIAYEGSLKIKEISYIHSEGYSSSSLKHGPFALLDENMSVILLDCTDIYSDKIRNCYEEVKSRYSPILLITNNNNIEHNNKIVIPFNKTFGSLLAIVPLQLIAYYCSINNKNYNINPDLPKNLAKVVTVE
jgi:glucosamine--fructose-6-phosphate aminotransferase (isomerizing)